MSRQLHDTTAQNLAAIAMNLWLLRDLLPAGSKARGLAEQCSSLTTECLTDVRAISYKLHPPLLDELGLEPALRHYITDFSRDAPFVPQVRIAPGLRRLPPDVEAGIFRIIQERLIVLARCNPTVSACTISLEDDTGTLVLTIEDNGQRVQSVDLTLSFMMIELRASQIGIALTVSEESQATWIRAIIARS